jgi:hypothetical protein
VHRRLGRRHGCHGWWTCRPAEPLDGVAPKRLADGCPNRVAIDTECLEQFRVPRRRPAEKFFEGGGQHVHVTGEECGHGIGEDPALAYEGDEYADVVAAEAAGLGHRRVEHGDEFSTRRPSPLVPPW